MSSGFEGFSIHDRDERKKKDRNEVTEGPKVGFDDTSSANYLTLVRELIRGESFGDAVNAIEKIPDKLTNAILWTELAAYSPNLDLSKYQQEARQSVAQIPDVAARDEALDRLARADIRYSSYDESELTMAMISDPEKKLAVIVTEYEALEARESRWWSPSRLVALGESVAAEFPQGATRDNAFRTVARMAVTAEWDTAEELINRIDDRGVKAETFMDLSVGASRDNDLPRARDFYRKARRMIEGDIDEGRRAELLEILDNLPICSEI